MDQWMGGWIIKAKTAITALLDFHFNVYINWQMFRTSERCTSLAVLLHNCLSSIMQQPPDVTQEAYLCRIHTPELFTFYKNVYNSVFLWKAARRLIKMMCTLHAASGPGDLCDYSNHSRSRTPTAFRGSLQNGRH